MLVGMMLPLDECTVSHDVVVTPWPIIRSYANDWSRHDHNVCVQLHSGSSVPTLARYDLSVLGLPFEFDEPFFIADTHASCALRILESVHYTHAYISLFSASSNPSFFLQKVLALLQSLRNKHGLPITRVWLLASKNVTPYAAFWEYNGFNRTIDSDGIPAHVLNLEVPNDDTIWTKCLL